MKTHASAPATNEQPLRVRFDGFELDEAEARLSLDGEPMALPPKPFAVLCALAHAPQRLVTTNELLDRVWGHRFVSDSVLKSAICDVRAVLRDDPKQPRYIETVSRRGYRFVGSLSVSPLPREAAESTVARMPSTASAMIGRAQELESLRAAWDRAGAGKRQIAWIAGEAGVGKTTLIESFTREMGEVRCAHGHCVEQHAAGESYLPVLEALTALCRQDATLPDLMRAVAPSWLMRLPWLCSAGERETLRAELSGAGEARMLREMGELLDRYTQDQPLLLVTEDLHWSDPATVHLMNYIARRRGSARLMWLASFRLTDVVATDHPFKAVRRELRLHRLGHEIVLDAFSEADVGEFVARRLPALASDERFVRELYERTDGLPLFVEHVIIDLTARGGADWKSVRLNMAWPIPESLTGIVERYVDQLEPEQRGALEVASVCGAEFHVSTVADVLGVEAAALAEMCADLVRNRRWLKDVSPRHETTTDARYAFRHGLYREVLYRRMGRLARDELHRKLDRTERRSGLTPHVPRPSRPDMAA